MQPEPVLTPDAVAEPVLDAAGYQALTGVSDSQLADLARYQDLLVDWNAVMNLVGPATIATYWTRHVLDSSQLLAMAPGAKIWADLGAGAGLDEVAQLARHHHQLVDTGTASVARATAVVAADRRAASRIAAAARWRRT